MASNTKYILKSVKAIEFYNKNPSIDFNTVNELFVELIHKVTASAQSTVSVNEIKLLLNTINRKVDSIENSVEHNNQMTKMTYDNMKIQKDFYIEQIKQTLTNNDHNSNILTLIRETNKTLIDKTIHSILDQFPKINENMTKDIKEAVYSQQKDMLNQTMTAIQPILTKDSMQPELIEKSISHSYDNISESIQRTFQSYMSQDSMFYQNNIELKQFLEKQKNSTLKGKESEEKLQTCLVSAFPNGNVINKSGESKACDYLLERPGKHNILFENKDYANNVPNEEIKKFIRDIEYQKCHGIMLSQNSGVTNKEDYQIDIHDNNIIVYVHFVKYDEVKIRIGVNLIDHLSEIINKNKDMCQDAKISMEQLSEINKEYLQFIGQKKQLIENFKKMFKEHMKQLESFEMPVLTNVLNTKFTNVDQLSYKCEICGEFTAKNKRALVTHQNKCKKNKMDKLKSKNEVVETKET